MASGLDHITYYQELMKEHPELVKVNFIAVQTAMDIGTAANSKKKTHEFFGAFLKNYLNITKEDAQFDLLHSLMFVWINHVIIDLVHNKYKGFVPDLDDFHKIIYTFREPYHSYALKLALAEGVKKAYILQLAKPYGLLVKKGFLLNEFRIKVPEPMKSRLLKNYYKQQGVDING